MKYLMHGRKAVFVEIYRNGEEEENLAYTQNLYYDIQLGQCPIYMNTHNMFLKGCYHRASLN